MENIKIKLTQFFPYFIATPEKFEQSPKDN